MGSDASPLRSAMLGKNAQYGVVASFKVDCSVNEGKRTQPRRGEQGSSTLAASVDKTSLQGGVTRGAAESFTDLAAQICHPYDRTPLESA